MEVLRPLTVAHRRPTWIFLVAAWFVVVLGLAMATRSTLPYSWRVVSSENDVQTSYPFVRWDAEHYLGIAQEGYTSVTRAGFFPAFPLLLRAAHTIFPIPWDWLGGVLSTASFVLGLWLLRSLEVVRRHNLGSWITVIMLTTPASFVFIAPYAEALFFFCSVLTMWSLERKRLWLGTAAVALGAASRPYGIILALPVLAAWWRSGRRALLPLALLAIVLPIIAWNLHLNAKLETFAAPILSQGVEYKKAVGFPLQELVEKFTKIGTAPNPAYRLEALNELLTIAVALVGLVGMWKVLPRSWFFASAIILGTIYLSGQLSGTPRYVFTLFTVIVGFAALASWRTRVAATTLGAGLLTINLLLFTHWFFVF